MAQALIRAVTPFPRRVKGPTAEEAPFLLTRSRRTPERHDRRRIEGRIKGREQAAIASNVVHVLPVEIALRATDDAAALGPAANAPLLRAREVVGVEDAFLDNAALAMEKVRPIKQLLLDICGLFGVVNEDVPVKDLGCSLRCRT